MRKRCAAVLRAFKVCEDDEAAVSTSELNTELCSSQIEMTANFLQRNQ